MEVNKKEKEDEEKERKKEEKIKGEGRWTIKRKWSHSSFLKEPGRICFLYMLLALISLHCSYFLSPKQNGALWTTFVIRRWLI